MRYHSCAHAADLVQSSPLPKARWPRGRGIRWIASCRPNLRSGLLRTLLTAKHSPPFTHRTTDHQIFYLDFLVAKGCFRHLNNQVSTKFTAPIPTVRLPNYVNQGYPIRLD